MCSCSDKSGGQIGAFGTVAATSNITVTAASAPRILASLAVTRLATGRAPGQATITALATSPDGSVVSAGATILVPAPSLPRVLSSLALLPSSQTLAATTDTAQFTAIGTYSSGSPATQDLTRLVSWRSSSAQIAQVNAAGSGTITGVANGTTVITCGTGAGCTGSFPVGQVVVLTASPGPASGTTPASQFDGWSVPCSPVLNHHDEQRERGCRCNL